MQITDEKKEVLQYIKSLGYSEASIKDVGKEYIVQGDISFPKDMEIPANRSLKIENAAPSVVQDKLMSSSSITVGSKISQTYTGYLVSLTNRIDVKVYIDPSVTNLANEINYAIGLWNSIQESGINFSIVASGSYDIAIINQVINGYGVARFPLNGSAGSLVRINAQSMINDGLTSNEMGTVIAHEIGHCIGFRHTDWSGIGESASGTDDVGTSADAIDVPNAGGTDVASIMNSGANNTLSGVLSNKDIIALLNLYPLGNPSISGPGIIRSNRSYTYNLSYIWPSSIIDWSINGKPASISFTQGQGTGTLT